MAFVWYTYFYEVLWGSVRLLSTSGVICSFIKYSLQGYIQSVSRQEKGAKDHWDKLQSEKVFVRTKEHVWRQNKDYVGSSNLLYNQCNCTMIFSTILIGKPWTFLQIITILYHGLGNRKRARYIIWRKIKTGI